MIDDITVFDFETTGIDPKQDRIVEVAAIRCIDGQIVSQFQSLVQFNGELPDKITEITGLTAADLAQGMPEDLAFKILRNMAQDSILVAHNAAFDLAFLHYWMQRTGGRTFSNDFIDTMTISRERHEYPHKLIDMTARYGIKLTGAHRALNDVIGCWELLKAMHAEEPIDDWVNRLGYLSKYGPPQWAPKHAKLFGTSNRYAS
ncbi:3'-5' exonuclease [Xylanibacillus composti]|uniref:DNA polymerase III subunit epsilon n=1 Tax=Xylanibacillus composti TaxID=1572762 RepID=A0A8J4H1S7_9BACL|nr:3'-5' exonuclease [Xylanibacillus composti]MDT9723807.1 3'-5' exonuclease [Xylanibacillus composti]GIQ67419.1 DNA polymerase III subunit epsilon [Xylanibacillus composti]